MSARGNEVGADPAQFTTTYTNNAFGDPTDIKDPLGKHKLLGYDADRNLTDVTDRDGRHTVYVYDAANQLTETDRPDGAVLKSGYDADGRIASQTDGLNDSTSYAYDSLSRLASIADPLKRQETLGYDTAGNLVSLVDKLGQTTTFGYDHANRLTSVSYSTGTPAAESFSYTPDGLRSTMTDATGTTSYGYDSLDRLTSSTSGAGQKTTYGYDLADELVSIGYPDALSALAVGGTGTQQPITEGTVTRGYDGDGNLHTVADWLGHTTTFGYDADENLASVSRPNGTQASYTYDANDALTALSDAPGQITYGRTGEELLASSTPAGGSTQGYVYDGARRLTSAGTAGYGYDKADDPTTLTDPGGLSVTQTFDVANQLESANSTAASTTFAYDANGNRTSATPSLGTATSYSYDQANQLTAVNATGISDQYSYDADGLRQTKTSGGQLTNEAYDRSGPLASMIEDGPEAYVTGPGGLPIEQVTETGSVRYYSHDQLGSTTALTDQNGLTVASYSYDAYGNPTGAPPAIQQPFGYAGQYTDSDTGLQYLRARYYDPATAQFLTRDPLEAQTRQPYGYANDDPANVTDPTGLCGFSSVGDVADCINPTSPGNVIYKGAELLKRATGVDLPGTLSKPAIVDFVTVGVCAVPATDAACLPAIAVAFGHSTTMTVAEGFATHWCYPGRLAAQEAVNAVLAGSALLGASAAGLAGTEVPRYVSVIIRGGPAAAQGVLDTVETKRG